MSAYPRPAHPYGASAAGLTSRPNASTSGGEFHVHVGAASAMDLDDEVAGLRGKVKMLKQMSNRIGEEASARGSLIDALSVDFSSSDAAMKDVRRKVEHAFKQAKSGHLMALMFFALCAFFGMFVFVKFSKVVSYLVPRGTGQSVRHH